MKAELCRFRDVGKTFSAGRVVRHINCVICEGDQVGILSASAKARRRLMELLLLQTAPDEGTIEMNDSLGEAVRTRGKDPYTFLVDGNSCIRNMSVMDNLLFLRHKTGRQLILSNAGCRKEAEEILKRYHLDVSLDLPAGKLTKYERYLLELAKAIEIYHVKFLAIDHIHEITDEKKQKELVACTDSYRRQGGAVIYFSSVHTPVFDQTDLNYYMHENSMVRTFYKDDGPYKVHNEAMLWQYRQNIYKHLVPPQKKTTLQTGHINITVPGIGAFGADTIQLGKGEILGVVAGEKVSDGILDGIFMKKKLGRLEIDGRLLTTGSLKSLIRQGVGLFYDTVERTAFQDLSARDNVEMLAFDKLCRIPGVLNNSLEKYFVGKFLDGGIKEAGKKPLKQMHRSEILELMIKRYAQYRWELLVMQLSNLTDELTQSHPLLHYIYTLQKQGKSVMILSTNAVEMEKICTRMIYYHDMI